MSLVCQECPWILHRRIPGEKRGSISSVSPSNGPTNRRKMRKESKHQLGSKIPSPSDRWVWKPPGRQCALSRLEHLLCSTLAIHETLQYAKGPTYMVGRSMVYGLRRRVKAHYGFTWIKENLYGMGKVYHRSLQ